MRDKRAAKCFKFYNNNLVLVIICFSRFCFARFGGFSGFVSLVSVVSFRWFRFVVSGFSTCRDLIRFEFESQAYQISWERFLSHRVNFIFTPNKRLK